MITTINLVNIHLIETKRGKKESVFPPLLAMRTLSTSVQFSLGTQLCPALCDPMDCSTPGLPVHYHSRGLLKLMSIESVMPSNHLILYQPLLLLPSILPSISLVQFSPSVVPDSL